MVYASINHIIRDRMVRFMSKKNFSYSYINQDGKLVSGAAATLHEIYTVNGGLKEYHDAIGKAYIEEFVNAHSEIINAGIEATSKRKRFRKIG